MAEEAKQELGIREKLEAHIDNLIEDLEAELREQYPGLSLEQVVLKGDRLNELKGAIIRAYNDIDSDLEDWIECGCDACTTKQECIETLESSVEDLTGQTKVPRVRRLHLMLAYRERKKKTGG